MRKDISVIAGVVVITTLIAGGYWIYRLDQQKKITLFNQNFQSAHEAYNAGDSNAALEKYDELIAQAPTTDAAALIKIQQANAYFARNQGTDQLQAAAILKSVSADNTIAARIRANAYSTMGRWLYMTGNENLMRTLVFNTPPYNDWLSQANGDITQATIKLFSVSNSLYPTAFANYEIAVLSSLPLLSETPGTGNKDQKQQVNDLKMRIATGDSLLSFSDYSKDVSFFSYLYLLRSVSLGSVSRYDTSVSTTTVDMSYEKTISIGDSDPGNLAAQTNALLARIFYAASLDSREHGLKNIEIQKLLKEVTEKHTKSFEEYLGTIIHASSANVMRQRLPSLATLSPEFKVYITQLGWK